MPIVSPIIEPSINIYFHIQDVQSSGREGVLKVQC